MAKSINAQTRICIQQVRLTLNGKQVFEKRNMSDRIREFELPGKIYQILVDQTAIWWHCRGLQTSFSDRWCRVYWFNDLGENKAALILWFVIDQ